MQTHDLAPYMAQLKKALGTKVGTDLREADLEAEFAKYLEYGVPVDQAMRTILRHHGVQTTPAARAAGPVSTERIPIAQLPPTSQSVNLKVRLITINNKTVPVRGEQKEIQWGLIGDETGSIPYTSWKPLGDVKAGEVLQIEGAYTKEYQGKVQVNFGDRTKMTKLPDDALPRNPTTFEDTPIASLKEGLRGIRLTGRVLNVAPRQVTVQGAAKTVWGGTLADASGQVEFSSWHDFNLQAGQAITIEGGYVRAFRGMPQYTFDADAKITPFTGTLPDATQLAVRPPATLGNLVEKGAASDITVVATMLEVRPGSGLVLRCTTAGCSRVLTAGQCRLHNRVEGGIPDLRIKAILDDGTGSMSAVIGREITEKLLGKNLDQCVTEAKAAFRPEVILDQLKEKLTARVYIVRGNVLSDDYGPSLIARSVTAFAEPKGEAAKLLLDSLAVA